MHEKREADGFAFEKCRLRRNTTTSQTRCDWSRSTRLCSISESTYTSLSGGCVARRNRETTARGDTSPAMLRWRSVAAFSVDALFRHNFHGQDPKNSYSTALV